LAATFWGWLLGRLGPRPGWLDLARAYYVSQLGKYVPGKALALVIRAALTRRARGPPRPAGLPAVHAAVTTLGPRAPLAALILLARAPGHLAVPGREEWRGLWRALIDLEVPPGGISPTLVLALAIALAALTLVPVLPPVFNRLAHHLSLPFRDPSRPVPR